MIYAKVSTLNAGTKSDMQQVKKHGFRLNQVFEVRNIYVGFSSTLVMLTHYGEEPFNSIFFEFIDGNGNPIDIYSNTVYQQNYYERYSKPFTDPSLHNTNKPKKKSFLKRVFSN